MICDTFDEIKNGINIRQNLSKLRQEIKEGSNKHAFLYHIGISGMEVFIPLLQSADAKTRKNTALLVGELGQEIFLEPIINAYRSETQLFVKSAYLQALGQYDYRKFLPELKERLDALTVMEIPEESKKHIQEEIRELSELIVTLEGVKTHKFIGYHEKCELVLLTNRDHADVTLQQLENGKAKTFNAGVIVQTEDLLQVMKIRTFQEMLFTVSGVRSVKMDAASAAKVLAGKEIFSFLKKMHEGAFPFYFRIEMKSKMPLDKKSAFVKKLSSEIESLSDRKLVNSTSHYEVEIRLIENKERNLNVLLKLFTIKDERFSYRKEVVASSIRPVNAALTAELAKKYMKEDAQVLDPFCGAGTMLIERHKAVKANTMYGIDIFGEAIKKARVNTEEAHQIIHYVNRDFFDFKHEYLFDEIITNMPAATGRTTREDIRNLYYDFFVKIRTHLQEDAVVILYTHNKELVKKFGQEQGFRIVESFEINKREETNVMILKS